MPRLITLSRAARLVGVKRGALQKKIRAGELRTFEGELLLSDLLHSYPQAQVEDTTMLERVEQIMEQAVNKIIRPPDEAPDTHTQAARILALGQELARARHEARRYAGLVEALKDKFRELAPQEGTLHDEAFSKLSDWFFQALETDYSADEASDDIVAKEAFLRVMAAQIRILPSGHEFFIEGSDSILEAGLRSGLALSYGCSSGNCGLCKAKVVSGQVKKICPHDYVLTETEKGLGYILTCSNTAVTDVVLEADEALGTRDIPHQEIDIRIKKVERPDDRVLILHAKTPRTNRLRFLAGQYLSLEADGLPALDCSIASCPCDDMNLQFHLPVVSGNPFIEHLRNNTRQNNVISIKGPRGEFILNEESPRSLLFIACNAGFGPVKSLIEHAMALDIAEQIHVYWIVTAGNSHYLGNLCRSWADALDNFHYTALATDAETSVEALLPNIVADIDDLMNYDCYACVPAPLVETLKTSMDKYGLPEKQLHLEPVR
ncbi:MAG: 2Fe-2S iron-sulfur cluster-binding protein [Gammaproteobacteria bacterium]|nr:2Fe-2S iron-sulfur cluster-binding protein [Gammaproteobacteria bacterium]